MSQEHREWVSIREHLEAQLKHERELRTAAEKYTAQALTHQAEEYERRLTVLNHAHEAAVEAQAKTVPRETYDTYIKDQEKKYDELMRDIRNLIGPLQAKRQYSDGRDVGIFIIGISLGSAIASVVVKLIFT